MSASMSAAPYAVSLVSERCQTPNNVLKVLDNDHRRRPDIDFAVCVTPLNKNFDNVHQLIEFVEVDIDTRVSHPREFPQ